MTEVLTTTRQPNYFSDIKYGTVAETDFENNVVKNCKTNGYTVFDVRKIFEYQKIDVDYIIDKKGRQSLPLLDDVISDMDYKKVEVKLDSRGSETGNFPYEVVSHSSSGWCVVTKCDFVYLVLTERDSSNIVKRAWIDMNKWHEYCANRKINKKLSYIKSENGIVDLLCNMDDMNKNGVLCWIK